MATKTKIDTRRHFISHMREPKGRGGWLFETEAKEVVFVHSGTYAEARKAAIQFGTEQGIAVLYTCP